MFKLILALCLLILTFAPDTDTKLRLQQNLRDKIDSSSQVTQSQQIPSDGLTTVDITENFRQKTASAKAAYFVDVKTGQILLKKNSDTRLPMASLSKLMVALVALDQSNLDDVLTVPSSRSHTGDALMYLKEGDRINVDGLLHGILLNSGSDAALTLADGIAGGEAEFVALMNERANTLGLKNTQFLNTVGWDETGNYTTAHDLAILSQVALSNPTIKNIVKKRSALVKSESGRSYLLTNTNYLLDSKNYLGTKTGTTYGAGECLSIYYKDSEKEVVGIVLNSANRFPETAEIIDWISNNYVYQQ